MKIDRIIYINLDRRPDRNEWWLDSMERAGVPMEIVERHKARDWQDYPSYGALIDDIRKSELLGPIYPHELKPKNVGVAALAYSFAECFEKIVNRGETTLLMHDDCRLHKSWNYLCNSLASIPVHAHLVQLEWQPPDGDRRINKCYPFEKDLRWRHGIAGAG